MLAISEVGSVVMNVELIGRSGLFVPVAAVRAPFALFVVITDVTLFDVMFAVAPRTSFWSLASSRLVSEALTIVALSFQTFFRDRLD